MTRPFPPRFPPDRGATGRGGGGRVLADLPLLQTSPGPRLRAPAARVDGAGPANPRHGGDAIDASTTATPDDLFSHAPAEPRDLRLRATEVPEGFIRDPAVRRRRFATALPLLGAMFVTTLLAMTAAGLAAATLEQTPAAVTPLYAISATLAVLAAAAATRGGWQRHARRAPWIPFAYGLTVGAAVLVAMTCATALTALLA